MALHTQPPTTPRGPWATPWRAVVTVMAAMAVIAAVVLTAFAGWYYVFGPSPPEVATEDAGPGVAQDIAEARRAVRWRPFDATAWGNLGLVHHLYTYEEAAARCYARAAELDTRSPRWPYLLAAIEMRSNLASAVALLERAVALGGEVLTPKLVMAEARLLQNRPADAKPLFEQVLASDPGNARALLGLGRVALEQADLPAARQLLERSARSRPVRSTYAALAQVLQRQGDAEQATAARAQAEKLPELAHWPDLYRVGSLSQLRGESAVVFRASALRQQGQAAQALELLKESLKLYPHSHKLRLALGRTHVAQQAYREAAMAYQQANRLQPDNLESHFECGRVLEHVGDFAGAAACLRRALQIRPTDAEAHHRLGRCQEMLTAHEEALASYREALRLAPDLVAAHQDLGALLASRRQDAQALAVLEQALQLDPAHATTQQQFAAVRARLKLR